MSHGLSRDPSDRNRPARGGEASTDNLPHSVLAARGLEGGSPYRSFHPYYFVESQAWRRLREILNTNGGAYALSGPRGAGKSWLMQRALSDAEQPVGPRHERGLALWYPCPSNYSAFDFLSTLSDNFADKIERQYRGDRLRPTLASYPVAAAAGAVLVATGIGLAAMGNKHTVPRLAVLGLAVIAIVMLWALWKRWSNPPTRPNPVADPARGEWGEPAQADSFAESTRTPSRRRRWPIVTRKRVLIAAVIASAFVIVASGPVEGTLLLAAVALGIGVAVVVMTLQAVRRENRPEQLLTREAGLLRERIRYSTTTRQSGEISATGGSHGFGAGLKARREKELVERPTSVASLIQDFRALALRAAKITHNRVVIAIDELDKIADADEVRALLRDIKGIFEVEGVYFFVSVSDQATRSLKMGGVVGRDEFNSSFYAVIDVPPMDPAFVEEIFHRRGTTIEARVALRLALLADNNPRETLRLADSVLRAGAGADIAAAVSLVMLSEVRAFRTHAMISTAPGYGIGLSDDERTILAERLDDERFAPDAFAASAQDLMDDWALSGTGRYWTRNLQNEWRRLLIRLRVAAESLKDASDMAALANVLRATDESPEVARRLLWTHSADAQRRELSETVRANANHYG